MKYCSKCGKELFDEAVICVGCGCAVDIKHSNQTTNIPPETEIKFDYLEKNHKKILLLIIFCFSLLILGLLSFLFINVFLGATVTLSSLIFAILLQSLAIKGIKKTNLDSQEKAYTKKIIKKHSCYKLMLIMIIIAGVLVCLEIIGIIIINIFLASFTSPFENYAPTLNSFMDFLTYLNSPEYALYENTRKMHEGLVASGFYRN